ncbi:MAG: hypothetical protein C5B43_01150 [Verrucomicrobia bacterium]|nr:MAG: hypothetical protein C5B43_01150 [Verrucomicrobiota bacterium]
MQSNYNNKNPKLTIAYLAWASVALFYFYQYILRVSPGVMIEEIRHDFSINADQFATLGSFYLYAYSLFQIPLGIIVDRIGVRRTILASIILCLGGTLLMASAKIFFIAQLSRIIIGIGSGCAFMCSLKIVADCLPIGHRGFFMGATLTLGTLGALFAGKPLVYFLDDLGWRSTMTYTALFGIPLILFAALFIPKPPKNNPSSATQELKSIGQNILTIIKNNRILLYAFLAVGLYAPLSALADLWGTAFIMQKYGLLRAQAAHTTMMMYVGLAAGSLIMPWICEKYNFLDRTIQFCGFGIIILFSVLLYGPILSTTSLTLLLIALGFFCGAEMMCFTGALLYSHPSNSGLTIGIVNTFNMLGGALLQQFIGYSLDFNWTGLLDETGIRIYESHHFTLAFSILTIIITICCLASLRLAKKKQKITV